MQIKKIIFTVLFVLANVQQVACMQPSRGIAPDVSFVFPTEGTKMRIGSSALTNALVLRRMLQENLGDYTIRADRPTDRLAIEKIFIENFGQFFESSWKRSRKLVLAVRGHVQGFIEYTPCWPQCYIEHVAIDENARRRGYAKKLLQALCEDLWSQRFVSISLDTVSCNLPARMLYEKFGFKDDNPQDSEKDRAISYTLNLKTWNASCKRKK
jgi:GNAT superfamily N-acetyltransferase